MKTEKRQPDYFQVSILMNVCYEQLEKTDDCFEREGDGGEGGGGRGLIGDILYIKQAMKIMSGKTPGLK